MNKEYLNDCPEYLQDFLFYMETIKGRSPRTVDGYYLDLRSFLRFLLIDNGIVPFDTDYKEIKISDASFDLVKNATRIDAMKFLSEFIAFYSLFSWALDLLNASRFFSGWFRSHFVFMETFLAEKTCLTTLWL